MCRRLTCGPHNQPDKSVNIGVAAHIIAASPGGPRYDDRASPEFRSSIENGIWLCQDCAKLIDSDEIRFSLDLLHDWKFQTEAAVRKQLEGQHSDRAEGPELVEKIDALIIESQQNTGQIEILKELLREYTSQLIENLTPKSAPSVTAGIVEMIPLDNGYWLHPDDVAAEGLCTCERNACVGSEKKVYCFWANMQSDWVKKKRQYWKCYDEIIMCPRCGTEHSRGHIGKRKRCNLPYKNQYEQCD